MINLRKVTNSLINTEIETIKEKSLGRIEEKNSISMYILPISLIFNLIQYSKIPFVSKCIKYA